METARRKNRAFTASAAFDGVREREKAGWTNELPYPIEVKITRRKWPTGAEKGLCGKDLRRNGNFDRDARRITRDNCATTARQLRANHAPTGHAIVRSSRHSMRRQRTLGFAESTASASNAPNADRFTPMRGTNNSVSPA